MGWKTPFLGRFLVSAYRQTWPNIRYRIFGRFWPNIRPNIRYSVVHYQGVTTRSVSKQKGLFQLKSEVVEEENMTDFLDQEDISESLEIDTSLNPEDKTKDCDKELSV